VLTLVFHDQDESIQEDVKKLDEALANTKHVTGKAIHTGPLIRQNEDYAHQSIDERRKQFFKLMAFLRRCPISSRSGTTRDGINPSTLRSFTGQDYPEAACYRAKLQRPPTKPPRKAPRKTPRKPLRKGSGSSDGYCEQPLCNRK
jgi:hypothetical protein